MIYPNTFEEKLGIDQVRSTIKEKCLSSMGEELTDEMAMLTDFAAVERSLSKVDEMLSIVRQYNEEFPTAYYLDLRQAFDNIQNDPTAWLLEQDVLSLGHSLTTVGQITKWLTAHQDMAPTLHEQASKVNTFSKLAERALQMVDESQHMRDSASKELANLRRDKQQAEKDFLRASQTALRDAQKNGYVARDAKPVVRSGHFLLPVSASNKRKIKGHVQDGSGSGKTVFIEPEAVALAGQEVRRLEQAERREIARLLVEFTSQVLPEVDALRQTYHFLGEIDFVRAKALYAHNIGGRKPQLVDEPLVDWHEAIHPLLNSQLFMVGKKANPLNVWLNENGRLLIVSGANAGGKSLCLKTVALLQYMLQCGLLIPVAEGSRSGIFHHILADIGDGQSIENSLSTYTAHLQHMKLFLDNLGPRTLILIDEFGSGTEPQMGGAMAQALLNRFYEAGSYGVITTHFQNLKEYADRTPGVENGAMLYDAEQMKPLYTLAIGTPGRSFAREVATSIGMPMELINEAAEIAKAI